MAIRKNLSRVYRLPAFWIVSTLAVAGIVSNLATGQTGQEASDRIEQSDHSTILREGTRLEGRRAGCRAAGDRLLVELEENEGAFLALENLASQRILKAVLDDAGDSHWIINGQVTEFQGRNFLLLDRVTRAAQE